MHVKCFKFMVFRHSSKVFLQKKKKVQVPPKPVQVWREKVKVVEVKDFAVEDSIVDTLICRFVGKKWWLISA